MDKLMQEASRPLRARMFNRDSSKPKEKRILVLKTGIAGMQYYIENDEERKAIDEITPGTELILYREPDNVHDELAIAVYLTENDKLGFITRFKNETIARLMDAGKKFVAVVDDQENDQEAAEIVNKRSGRTGTENMAVPFSVYMVDD